MFALGTVTVPVVPVVLPVLALELSVPVLELELSLALLLSVLVLLLSVPVLLSVVPLAVLSLPAGTDGVLGVLGVLGVDGVEGVLGLTVVLPELLLEPLELLDAPAEEEVPLCWVCLSDWYCCHALSALMPPAALAEPLPHWPSADTP